MEHLNSEQREFLKRFIRENTCTFKLNGDWGNGEFIPIASINPMLRELKKLEAFNAT